MKLKTMLVASAAVTALTSAASLEAGTYVSLFGGFGSFEAEGVDITLGPYTHLGSGKLTFGTSTDTNPGYVLNTRVFFPGDHSPQSGGPGGASLFTSMVVTNFSHHQYTISVNNDVTFTFAEENLDVGFVIGAALGYEFDLGLRLELEASHRSNDIGGPRFSPGEDNLFVYRHVTNTFVGSAKFYQTSNGTTTNLKSSTTKTTFIQQFTFTTTQSTASARAITDGNIATFAVMANIWYDLDIGRDTPVSPFFGAGVGLANVDVSYDGSFVLPNTTILFNSDTSDWVPAWQVGGGVIFDMGEVSLSAQYRYFATGDVTLPGGGTIAVESHAVLVGATIPLGRQGRRRRH